MRFLPLAAATAILASASVAGVASPAVAATGPSVSALTLYNADTDKPISGYTALANGVTLNLATLPTPRLNILAVTSPATVGSVRFVLDGKQVRVENAAPYSLGGDGGTDIYPWTPSLGSHVLKVTPYTSANLHGAAGPTRTLSFTVTKVAATAPATAPAPAPAPDPAPAPAPDPAPAPAPAPAPDPAPTGPSVQSFSLMNADTDQVVSGYTALSSGVTLNLATLPTPRLNIAANTVPSTVGSVAFDYDGARVRLQNSAPYTLGGDDGTDIYPWTPSVGTHTVTATPFSGANLTGTAGTPKTITFTVTNTPIASSSTTTSTTTTSTTTPTPATRSGDLALQPFAADSPWNTPTSLNTQFAGSGDARMSSLMSGGTYINSGAYSIPVFIASSSDPTRTISSPEGTVTIHVPANATAANGTDGVFTIIDPTHTSSDEFWVYDGGSHASRWVHNSLSGSGVGNGIRAAGYAVLGGLIREWEVNAGSIDHALALVIPSAAAKSGYVWPAVSQDSYASQYSGNIPLGTRFAIPRSVDVTTLGLNADGLALARALQNYGAFVGDTSAPGTNNNMILSAEPTLEGTSHINNLRNAWSVLRGQLRPVIG